MMVDSLAKEPPGRSFVVCAAPDFYLRFVIDGFYWNNTGFVSTAHLGAAHHARAIDKG